MKLWLKGVNLMSQKLKVWNFYKKMCLQLKQWTKFYKRVPNIIWFIQLKKSLCGRKTPCSSFWIWRKALTQSKVTTCVRRCWDWSQLQSWGWPIIFNNFVHKLSIRLSRSMLKATCRNKLRKMLCSMWSRCVSTISKTSMLRAYWKCLIKSWTQRTISSWWSEQSSCSQSYRTLNAYNKTLRCKTTWSKDCWKYFHRKMATTLTYASKCRVLITSRTSFATMNSKLTHISISSHL